MPWLGATSVGWPEGDRGALSSFITLPVAWQGPAGGERFLSNYLHRAFAYD